MYTPAEDSFLLLKNINKYIKPGTKFLEIGAGSGIISEKAKQLGAEVLATDIDSEVVGQLKRKNINIIKSNLFNNINNKDKFDLIVFNPPYLPEHKHDKKKDTTGGKRGDETIIKFLKQAKNYLNKDGKILLITSSLTPMKKIDKILDKDYKSRIIDKKKLFFEQLFLYELSLKTHKSL